MLSLGELHLHCYQFPELVETNTNILFSFIALIRHLRPQLSATQRSSALDTPPQCLPMYIHEFLQHALDLNDQKVTLCWTTLKDIAWHAHEHATPPDLAKWIPVFLRHGLELNIGTNALWHRKIRYFVC